MDLIDIITQAQGGQNLKTLSQRFGLDETQTRAAIDQLGPAVESGIRRETTSPDGLSGLLAALTKGNHARYLEGDEDGIVDDGNAILGHVFGSKDVSRGVAARAAETTGVEAGVLKQMLPVVAAMVMGALAKNAGAASGSGSGGGIGDILGQALGSGAGGGRSPSAGGGGGLGDILGQVLGVGTGGASPASSGGIGDILSSILGGDAAPEVRREATEQAGGALGNMLGGNTQRGNAADELLASVQRSLNRS